MEDLESTVMEIIVNAGQTRSLCFSALQAARDGDFAQAQALLRQSDEFSRAAHRVQTRLIEQDGGEGKTPMTLIMVHAQDHLMNAILARELIAEMVELYQRQRPSAQG
ncbi:PTS lactose/cellobiose transporter subunit IIA [Serratia rubidaea]|uniref:N,N'-diacetylchitobiose-specific phosphotransferase enzyme IIA component n=1 Tax=Serratia rubidaea TaxID=61652 RepID=A0A3S4X968_SERRU|nr:PTS lactose/cellobiose transporter subunit IIA [Serratia rubidaea]MCR1000177.1 PTS lactose/cellobiose transporter subunit IIA [Serratia rubidaea]MDK1702460.1 PTS lactose/cellobiose transporter subunit IIA [Serratia rubidaea]MEB7585218.1 PTS lactose/cellobiose transporter subunit IIA [Serratia rubidaea]UJD80979.1 PTS lactose/cellobiose transporter subunit IIA [Serratia rubidaea]UJD85538.1 PTS lactose/cellobiose transporter subunit IIA [Serratia rubidaea]